MAHKSEIGWKRRTEEGERLDVFARHVGTEWIFFRRSRRYEQWQRVPHPPLEDWMELLDAVERRVTRRRLRPEEIDRVKASIRQHFPDADLG